MYDNAAETFLVMLDAFRRMLPTACDRAVARVAEKVHLGELWPDHITHVEKNLANFEAAKVHDLRETAVRTATEIAQRYDLRAYVEQMRPEEFQPGAGGALPGTTLRKGGRFDLERSIENGLNGDTNQDPGREAKRQLVARRVEGGGNNGLGALTAGATAMGIFFLGPLGAASGAASLVVDAVKGPELVFVNGKITPAQVKTVAQRFEKARPLPRAITAAVVRRALEREDLDDVTRARLRRILDEARSLSNELLEEGERIATIALFARRLERREIARIEDDEAREVAEAFLGLAPANHAHLAPWVRMLIDAPGAPPAGIRARAMLDAALSL